VSGAKMWPNEMNLGFGNIWRIQIFKEITENKCVDERYPFVKGDNLTNTAWKLENGKRYDVL